MKNSNRFGIVVSIVFLICLFLALFSISSTQIHALTEVSGCQALDSENETYILTQDIQTNITCFNVTAFNITLNGNGSRVLFNETPTSPQYIINISLNGNYTQILNITLSGEVNVTGIFLFETNNITIRNTSFSDGYSDGFAVYALNVTNLLITNNSIFNYSQTGFYFDSTRNVTLSNLHINQTLIPLSTNRSTIITVRNITFDETDVSSQSTLNLESTSHSTLTDIFREPISLHLFIRGNSTSINITNFNFSFIEYAHRSTNLRAINGTINQEVSSAAIRILNNSNLLFENLTIQNALTPIISIESDADTNASMTNITFTNISYTNWSAFFINKTSYDANVSIRLRNTVADLFDATGNLFITSYEQYYGLINLTLPINGTANFSQLFQIYNVSIVVNDSQVEAVNQSLNISFFNLQTNYGSQKLFYNDNLCLSPECSNISILNRATVSYRVDRAGNFTLQDIGVQPPGVVTSLVASQINNNNLTWTWTNPADIDFNGTLIFINDVNVINLSKLISTYNRSSLLHNTNYTIRIQTIDYDGYKNTTIISQQISTSTAQDIIAPSSVLELNASVIDRDLLFYNWTLPTDEDYSYLQIKFNDLIIFSQTNITNLTFAGLIPNTTYNFTITSFDINANSNATSNISTTLDDTLTITNISSCGTISTSGNYTITVPTLQTNYTCLFISASNVNIDGNGSTITFGSSNESINASGILINGVANITVNNLTIVGNQLFNLSRNGVYVNASTNVVLNQTIVQRSTTGALFATTTNITIDQSEFTNTNRSVNFIESSSITSIQNTIAQNSSIGFLFGNATQVTLANVTASNLTMVALNISGNSQIIINQFNWTLPTNTTTALLIDAQNTTSFSNSSMQYGNILFSNFSTGNVTQYTIGVSGGNFTLSKINMSAVSIRLNASPIDSFNFTQAIILAYNSVFVNATLYPYLNLSAVITFYNMSEGSPVYKLRNGVEFNTTTTPFGSSITSLTVASPVINTTSLDGNYSLRGYTLKLLFPADDSEVTDSSEEFTFYVTPTYNRTLLGCNLSLNGTLKGQWSASNLADTTTFSYSISGLSDNLSYAWSVYCLDNLSTAITKTQEFTVQIPEVTTTSSSRRSGAFGSASGAPYPWINTFLRDTTELNQSFFISLKLWDGVRIKVNNNSHHVGIIAVTDRGATINVSSKPQQATLAVKETKQFVLDENESMGISVTLEGVSIGRANITVTPIVLIQSSSTNATINANNSANSTSSQSSVAENAVTVTSGGSSAQSAGAVLGKFVATKGVIVLVVIAGIILVCGLVYYFYLILRYKKGMPQVLNQLSAKKGLLAEFLYPFMPGGEFWQNKKKESIAAEKLVAIQKGPRAENIQRYQQTIVPLLPKEHTQHIESRLSLGNSFAFIEFELIENGYPREVAKSLVQQYQIDQYVKNCIYAGATNEQVRNQLLSSGWSGTLVAKVFRPAPVVEQVPKSPLE